MDSEEPVVLALYCSGVVSDEGVGSCGFICYNLHADGAAESRQAQYLFEGKFMV